MRAHDPGAVALPVARFLGLALVGLALALGEAELKLGAAALVEIDGERHDGNAVALDRAQNPVDLAAMKQEPTLPPRLVIEPRRGIDGDLRVDEDDLVALLGRIGFGDAAETLAQHLHLGADELDAGLERVLDEIVAAGPPIERDVPLVATERRHQSSIS